MYDAVVRHRALLPQQHGYQRATCNTIFSMPCSFLLNSDLVAIALDRRIPAAITLPTSRTLTWPSRTRLCVLRRYAYWTCFLFWLPARGTHSHSRLCHFRLSPCNPPLSNTGAHLWRQQRFAPYLTGLNSHLFFQLAAGLRLPSSFRRA